MKSQELERQVELAKELEATLTRVKALWDELPSEEDLQEMLKVIGFIEASLKESKENAESLRRMYQPEQSVEGDLITDPQPKDGDNENPNEPGWLQRDRQKGGEFWRE